MSHPAYYQTQQESYKPYRPGDYVPQSQLQLTQSRHSPQPSPTYGPPVAYQPGPYEPESERYTYTETRRSSKHHRRHSSDSRAFDRRYKDDKYDGDGRREKRRSRSRSREKSLVSTLAGAAGGGYLGHELGGGAIGTVGGLLAGAIGARELEKRHEKNKRSRSRGGHSRGTSRSRRSSPTTLGGLVDKAQDKVESFLSPQRAHDRDDERRRRYRHDKGSRSLSRGRYSDSDSDDYYRWR